MIFPDDGSDATLLVSAVVLSLLLAVPDGTVNSSCETNVAEQGRFLSDCSCQ